MTWKVEEILKDLDKSINEEKSLKPFVSKKGPKNEEIFTIDYKPYSVEIVQYVDHDDTFMGVLARKNSIRVVYLIIPYDGFIRVPVGLVINKNYMELFGNLQELMILNKAVAIIKEHLMK